jgi:hypothetical protein
LGNELTGKQEAPEFIKPAIITTSFSCWIKNPVRATTGRMIIPTTECGRKLEI